MGRKSLQKTVFLDRDGVINKKMPEGDYVKNWDEFEFLPGAIEAVKLLNQNGYQVYVITNQRGIARGLMTEEDLDDIHQKMQRELKRQSVNIDDIYYCPHNYEDNCDCRKPKPGMLLQAASDHNLDLTKAICIGDSNFDVEAGKAAGCKAILVETDGDLLKVVEGLFSSL